jgi:predicted nucleic acid-binding protein
VKAVDSSVAIAAFGDWHVLNDRAIAILDEGAFLPVHALLESYSVLTAFPPPHRASANLVDRWFQKRFNGLLPSPTPEEQRRLVSDLASAGRAGGAVYDGLIGLTAKLAGAELITADRRAASVYELLGVDWRSIETAGA